MPKRPNLQHEAAARPSVGTSLTASVAATGPSVDIITATADIHAGTPLTQTSNISPLGRNNGQSDGTSARQGRAVSWKSAEEDELRRLIGIHTNSKGSISWVSVCEAWITQNMPIRSKAGLSSKWYEIRSRTAKLTPARDQVIASSPVVLSRKSEARAQSHQNPSPAQEVNQIAEVNPMATTQAPVPVCSHTPQLVTNSCSDETITSVFKKNLKKARRIGCQTFRESPRRVAGKHIEPILSKVDSLIGEEVGRKINGQLTWNQLSILVYAGATTVDELGNQTSDERRNHVKQWFQSSYEEVDQLRRTIGKATAELQRRQEHLTSQPTVRQLRNIRLLEKKYKCRIFVDITSLVEKLKCRLHLLLSRIALRKADEQRSKVRRSPPNTIFRDKESKEVTETADVHQIRRFWKTIVGVKKTFEHENPLLVAWKQALPQEPGKDDLKDQLNWDVWQRVVRKLKPWKASGPDGLQSFWWKRFATANASLYKLVHHHLTSGANLPHRWISDGRVVLLHKSGPRSDPANFRPIACLNTCYKLLTGFISVYLD